jgi:hypothetical protein
MKINLLPGRVKGKSNLQAIWALVTVLILAELAGLGFYQKSLRDKESQVAADVVTKQAEATRVNKIGDDANAERAKVRDIDTKVKFVKEVTEYNEVRPDLYARTVEYTLEGVRYTSMSASQNLLQIGAWAPSLADAGRYLLFMENSPDFSAVRISGVPGYPPGGQGAGGAAGPGESGAIPGNSGGAPSSGAFAPSGPEASGGSQNSGGGFTPSGGPGSPGFSPGGQGAAQDFGGGGPGGAPGGAFGPGAPGGGGQGGGGGQTVYGGAFMNAGARFLPPKPPQGFPFTVTAQLVKPIVRPLFGQNPQQAGFGGAFGGPGGSAGEFTPGAVPGGANPYGPGAVPPGAGPPGPEGPAGAVK